LHVDYLQHLLFLHLFLNGTNENQTSLADIPIDLTRTGCVDASNKAIGAVEKCLKVGKDEVGTYLDAAEVLQPDVGAFNPSFPALKTPGDTRRIGFATRARGTALQAELLPRCKG
jgi:hypothetical protein